MVAAIAAIIVALISYFGAKKSGATSAQAGLVAAAAGAGTYYVATETDWGKSLFGDADAKGVTLTGPDGQIIKDKDGNAVMVPEGSSSTFKDGKLTITTPSGNVWTSALDSVTGVLKSWGGTGTAAVIGAGGLVSSDTGRKWLPWLAAGALALLLLR